MSKVTAEVKARVNAEIQRCIDVCEAHYHRKFDFPTIVYKKRGTTAGTANDGTYTIDLNPVLLMENQDAFMTRTVPHEFAHLVDGLVYPETRCRTRRKRSVHGPTWKSIMGVLGCEASRCHTYDVTSVTTQKNIHLWVCGCGIGEMKLSERLHQSMTVSANRYVRGHSPKKCGAYTYVGRQIGSTITVPPKEPLAAETPKQPPKKKAPASSKLNRCRRLFDHSLSRARNIARFVEAGCTSAGAATYYAKIKKERTCAVDL